MDSQIIKKPELLAPAGNLEKLKIAIRYGADAVYIAGEQFGLRKAAGNFSYEEMREGVQFAHLNNAKVYVAMNIIAHNEDLTNLEEYLINIEKAGVDAIIFADPAIYLSAKDIIPNMELHVSTQMSTTNWRTVDFWKQKGVKRVVLARELSLEEVSVISKNVDVEIECFIHGAMCVAYSGRCLLSNYMASRDANRGGCAQSCRWKYGLANRKSGKWIEPNNAHYLMNSKDLCMIEHIPAMINAGITSFKVEGRMKSIHYVATVTNVYRQAIDKYFMEKDNYKVDPNWIKEIQKASHRPLSTGFYFNKPTYNEQMYLPGEKLRKYDFVGIVFDYNVETKMALIEQRNHFKIGDEIEFIGPKGTFFTQIISKIVDNNGQDIDAAPHPLEKLYIYVEQPVKPYYLMRKENI